MPGITVKDKIVQGIALFLKKSGKLKTSDYIDLIKMTKCKELVSIRSCPASGPSLTSTANLSAMVSGRRTFAAPMAASPARPCRRPHR